MKLSLVGLLLAFCLVEGCIARPPPHPRALECNELCTRYLSEGDLNRAEVQCDLGLQFSPEYADLWVNKGLIALKRGNDDKAKENFIKALRYNQEQAQAYNNLGYVYFKAQEYGKAHDNLQRALKVNPDYLEARYNLALVFQGLKQTEKARKEFQTIVEINPGLADPHAHLGQMALEDGENDEAIEQFGAALKLDPNYVDAWLMRGNAYMEASKPCEAKDDFSSCIEIDENNIACRNNIIIAQKKCALQTEAKKGCSEKTPQCEYSVALAAREKGQINEEERAYKRCLKYNDKFAPCYFGLFQIFEARSDEKNATTACRNFMKFANGSEFDAQITKCQQFLRE